MNEINLKPIHCTRCGRFLGFEMIVVGVVQLKCPKCKDWTQISNIPEDIDNGEKKRYTPKRKVRKVA